jgi:hypothetical protein
MTPEQAQAARLWIEDQFEARIPALGLPAAIAWQDLAMARHFAAQGYPADVAAFEAAYAAALARHRDLLDRLGRGDLRVASEEIPPDSP